MTKTLMAEEAGWSAPSSSRASVLTITTTPGFSSNCFKQPKENHRSFLILKPPPHFFFGFYFPPFFVHGDQFSIVSKCNPTEPRERTLGEDETNMTWDSVMKRRSRSARHKRAVTEQQKQAECKTREEHRRKEKRQNRGMHKLPNFMAPLFFR